MEVDQSNHINELLHRPLEVVSRLFAQRNPHDQDDSVDSDLVAMLERLNIGKEIELPSLNHIPLDQLKDGMMVRYRGMVQDILNPEYYLAVYEEEHEETGQKNIKSARYRDVLDSSDGFVVIDNSPSSRFGQRLRLYCVPIPGQTKWADDLLKPSKSYQSTSTSSNVDNGDKMDEDDMKPRQKRSRADEDESEAVTDPSAMQGIQDVTTNEGQRAVPPPVGESADQRVKKDAAPNLNFPIPGSSGTPCVVKIYEDNEEAFKVSEIVEFEGILSHRYEVQVAEGADDEEHLMMRDYVPPAGLVPQLHCIRYRKLHSVHPHLSSSSTSIVSASEWMSARGGQVALEEARQAVLDHLTNCLFGDRLAAEYLLLHLLSKVYGRVTELDPLGNFPLNFIQVPTSIDGIPTAEYFRSFLSELVPALHVISLSRETLQTSHFMPYKDYDHERLISGQLQLAAGTELIIDETALTEGQLEQKSYAQLLALGTLVSSQRVTYDFKYYQSDVPTDLPVIVLSSGKSMFKSAVTIPITIDPNWRPDRAPQLETVMSEFRFLLASLRTTDVKPSSDEISKHLQDDFVEMRKTDPSFTADMFRSWLTVCRVMSISHGEESVSAQRWLETKQLETARMSRLPKNTSNTNTKST